MRFSTLSIFFIFILTITSCGNYKLNYSKEVKSWDTVQLPTDKELSHTIYLVGDAGASPDGGKAAVLKALEPKLSAESENSSIIYLGDNIYPSGMPPKGDESRKDAEHKLTAQLEILNNFKGNPFFLPGNHDWWKEGKKGLRRQEKFVEKYLNKQRGIEDDDDKDWGNYFLPDDGCSGPEVVEINDQLVIIFIDSQWWMKNWDKEPHINDGCPTQTRAMFIFNFENAVRKHRTKNVVIAMHHPLRSYGPHGGSFSFKEHMKPAPVLGTVVAALRKSIGHSTDLASNKYRALSKSMGLGLGKNGSFILAAGHEHNLQYITQDNQHYIVSGSGSKVSSAKIGKGSKFAYGGNGYSKLYFYDDGSTYLEFYQVRPDGSELLVYREKIKDKLGNIEENIPEDFPEFEKGEKTATSKVAKFNAEPVSGLHRFFLGEHFREVYNVDYEFPTINLNTVKGGLTPIKQGGGNQTNSLRVRSDETDRDYVLRGLTKDATRFIPFPFNKMDATGSLVEETFLSTHPFAPLAMPVLSDAIGIYHTNPTLYYVQPQPRLKYFNDVFSGSVHLLEERPGGKKWKDSDVFGGPDKLIGTPDLVENMEKNSKHRVDQSFALRSRLFDLIVGDWDRHDDQWRWSSFKQEDGTVLYRPVPRDRDQAFSRYDGLVIWFSRLTLPFLKSLRVYGPEIEKLKWLIWSGRHFDHSFINQLSWHEWEEEVKHIQTHLTDEAIEKGLEAFPEEAYKLTAPHIIKSIKQRRDDLMEYARSYYEYHSKLVEIVGTNDRDLFEIVRQDDGTTLVQLYDFKKGKKGKLYFERLIETDVTKEIVVYGRQDKDKFVVSGDVKKGPLVRLVGGLGKDHFIDNSRVSGLSKKTKVYDNFEKNTLELGSEAKDKRTKRREYNQYDRRNIAHEFDAYFPVFWGGFNPDEGVFLGGKYNVIKYGFNKKPYKSSNSFGLGVTSRTRTLRFTYDGDYIDLFNKVDFIASIDLQTPTSFSRNFFGLGNESVFDYELGRDFYRVRDEHVDAYVAVKNTFLTGDGFFAIGPLFRSSTVLKTEGRFLAEQGQLPDFTFDRKYFGGVLGKIEFDNTSNLFNPKNGIRFHIEGQYLHNISQSNSYDIGVLKANIRIYQALDKNEKLVFATKVGGGRVVGNDAEFFSQASIGGNEGLRGYSFNRFYGRSSFYHDTDLRLALIQSINSTLPFSLGLFGGFDYGRVWEREDISERWHYNYGGGIWFAPVNTMNLAIGYYIPRKSESVGGRVGVNLGFAF